jgi:hypothetical protein
MYKTVRLGAAVAILSVLSVAGTARAEEGFDASKLFPSEESQFLGLGRTVQPNPFGSQLHFGISDEANQIRPLLNLGDYHLPAKTSVSDIRASVGAAISSVTKMFGCLLSFLAENRLMVPLVLCFIGLSSLFKTR